MIVARRPPQLPAAWRGTVGRAAVGAIARATSEAARTGFIARMPTRSHRTGSPVNAGFSGTAQYCGVVAGRNGKHSPPRPKIEIQAANASPEEAAATAAALEQFLAETA